MNWKQSLDRYLTTEPPDNYTPWVERTLDLVPSNVLTEEMYEQKEHTIDAWLDYLNSKGYNPKEAADLITKTISAKQKRETELYESSMNKWQEEERRIAEHNNRLLAQIEEEKGTAFFEELIEVIQDSEGIQGRAELVKEPVGTYQEEDGVEIPGIWVDQTTNGGHTGDTFAGTVCVKIRENSFLKFQYSM